jgi:hypothetical protein
METFKPGLVVVPNEAGARAVDDAIEDSVPTKILRVSLGVDESRRWKSLLDLAADASNPSALDQNKLLETQEMMSHSAYILCSLRPELPSVDQKAALSASMP